MSAVRARQAGRGLVLVISNWQLGIETMDWRIEIEGFRCLALVATFYYLLFTIY
jgi:hypothetical protein